MISGKHSIGGEPVAATQTFRSQPYSGIGHEFSEGSAAHVNDAAKNAAYAFESYANSTTAQRAALLMAIAGEIDSQRDQILKICEEETGLLTDRLAGEFSRTVNQLRYFADLISTQDYLEHLHDPALPDRSPLPRPDLRVRNRPVGPVAVFGASNFPLAFSTAGGDTASALAVGCPVLVKGHSAHPGTSELVANCIVKQVKAANIHPGVFSHIQSSTFEAGTALVQHPAVKAVGFTGSLGGGRALYNLCAAREEPIPFYGELGSVNPVFMLPNALAQNVEALAAGWIASLTVGAGQMCTNPGLVIMLRSEYADRFAEIARQAAAASGDHVLLGENIADAFRHGHEQLRNHPDTTALQSSVCARRSVSAGIYRTTAQALLNNDFIAEEVFGPLGTIVEAETVDEVFAVAKSLKGQLTCTLQMVDADNAMAKQLYSILEHKAGRLVFNGFPTGVEVCDSMVHGGPYPASTNFGATSVGGLSIRRFLRPVCYQNLPESWSAGV